MKFYQILTVSRTMEINFIVPDPFIFSDLILALQNVKNRMSSFEDNGEVSLYRGEISSLEEIANIYKDKVVLNNNSLADNIYNLDYLPYVINDIDSIYDSFVKNFNKIDNSILYRISQIEYKPNDIDEERFLLYMIDGNYVYISLSKIEKINKYNSIVASMKDQKGIIYLDSGDYVEIKK